jgi:hypothetical protein
MASDHAGFAAGAAVEVYYESPLVFHTILPFLADGAGNPTQAKSGLEWAPRRLWWENKN